MWTEDDLIEVIHDFPAVANDALKAIQLGLKGNPIDLDAFNAAAVIINQDGAKLCIDQLKDMDLLSAFVQALLARGVDLDTEPDGGDRVDNDDLSLFSKRAKTFRCRVQVDQKFKGTGCLVGPGLVLTAWHVVAVAAPGSDQTPDPEVRVQLADGSIHDASVPPCYASPCSDGEWNNEMLHADSDLLDRHDVALLALNRPAARHLGYARMPTWAPDATSRSRLYLLDFPNGQDQKMGNGTTWKIRNVTQRLRHDIRTEMGSSGGACFNNRLEFLGLHQGIGGGLGRLVPLSLFIKDVTELISKDIAPLEVWHLDGQSSRLVIGRDLFISAIAEAGKTSPGCEE